MPLRHGRYTDATHRNRRIERIITASVGLVQSGQHLEHNAQRQNVRPYALYPYFAGTIEGKQISFLLYVVMDLLTLLRDYSKVHLGLRC